MSKYLDQSGLSYLWSKIKSFTYSKTVIDAKIDAVEGTIQETEESQIDMILNGETVVEGSDGALDEITEAEIDAICAMS